MCGRFFLFVMYVPKYEGGSTKTLVDISKYARKEQFKLLFLKVIYGMRRVLGNMQSSHVIGYSIRFFAKKNTLIIGTTSSLVWPM